MGCDTPFCVEWAKKPLKSAIEEEDHFVLFCNNLQGQISDGFKDAVGALDGLVWYGVANATDIWQPIDAGYAQLLKMSIKQEFFKWLDDDDSVDRWYGESISPASEKRILITNWVGKAYRMICSSKYDTLRYRLFQKTGTLITADGSDDELIQPEGLPDYKVPPPSVLDPVPARPISLTSIEEENSSGDIIADDFEEEDFQLVAEQEEGKQVFELFEKEVLSVFFGLE